MQPRFRPPLLALLAILAAPSLVRAQALPKAELVQRGKAATAFVEIGERLKGSAFCIHPSGIFITCFRVFGSRRDVSLVLDSGLETQRVEPATVLRIDKDLDLALIRIVKQREFPSLPLGAADRISEATDAIAFGYPLLAPTKRSFPDIVVTAGLVSSLQRKNDELFRIKVDIKRPLNFGNSGGPVLDEAGKVIGVIPYNPAAQGGQVIPVNLLRRFLDAPDIQFTPPILTMATLRKPSEFKAKVIDFVPGRKDASLRLILQPEDDPPREFAMTRKADEYAVKAVATDRTDLEHASPIKVQATLIASASGAEVARLELPISVKDSRTPASPPLPIRSGLRTLDGPVVARRLSEPFAGFCQGGGGRYLVFHLPRVRKLAVFDTKIARFTAYLPLAEDNVVFAAGMNRLVVGLPGKGTLERWNLTTMKREYAGARPFAEEIKTIVMGSEENVCVVVNGRFLDLETFRPSPYVDEAGNSQIWGTGDLLCPSADGTVITSWTPQGNPASTVFAIEGKTVKKRTAGDMGHLAPGPDGRLLFTANGVRTTRFQRADPADEKTGYALPSAWSDIYFTIASAEGPDAGSVTVRMIGQSQPIARIDDFANGLRIEPSGASPRIFFLPAANLFLTLPASNDQIVMRRFDFDAALEKSGIDYLTVTSSPSQPTKAGECFNYPIAVKAKHGPVSFEFASDQMGLSVSRLGFVTWDMPAATAEGKHELTLKIRDAQGREILHAVTVRIKSAE